MDELLLDAVVISAGDVVGVLDDVIEEFEGAGGVQRSPGRRATCRVNGSCVFARWKVVKWPRRSGRVVMDTDVRAEWTQESVGEHLREQEEWESVLAEKLWVVLLRRYPVNLTRRPAVFEHSPR